MYEKRAINYIIYGDSLDAEYKIKGFRVGVSRQEMLHDLNKEKHFYQFDHHPGIGETSKAKRNTTAERGKYLNKGEKTYKKRLKITEGTARMPIVIRKMLRSLLS